MQWRLTEAVQTPCGLWLEDETAIAQVMDRLRAKPHVWGDIRFVHGLSWLAISGPVLPHVKGARAFYSAHEGWYLPVGVDFAVPEHVRDELLSSLVSTHAFQPPALLLPDFKPGQSITGEADAYLLSPSYLISSLANA